MSGKNRKWLVYILECKDATLYTGITDNLEKRIAAHNCGRGAKYTRGRGPLQLRYVEEYDNHSQALRREIAIKRLSRNEKIRLCDAYRTVRVE